MKIKRFLAVFFVMGSPLIFNVLWGIFKPDSAMYEPERYVWSIIIGVACGLLMTLLLNCYGREEKNAPGRDWPDKEGTRV